MVGLDVVLLAMKCEDGYVLSPHFTLRELCRSTTAMRNNIANDPTTLLQVEALRALAINVLEPTRTKLNVAIDVESGLRSAPLNTLVKGQKNSQHCVGEAADIRARGVSNAKLLKWIRDNVEFDQLILEFAAQGQPFAGWVHVSFSPGRNRRQVLHIDKLGTHPGLPDWALQEAA